MTAKPHTKHLAFTGIRDSRRSNNKIERYHGTTKERLKVMRALDNDQSATAWNEGVQLYYNYIRSHMGLEGRTPAEAAQIDLRLNGNRWESLIKQSVKPRV